MQFLLCVRDNPPAPTNGATNAGELIETELNQVAWGNLESNLEFLRRADVAGAPAKILEIGCGRGAMLDHLRGAGHAVTGIDIDAAALSQCQESYPGLSVFVASGDALPFADGSFDIVLSFDVFEHIKDSDRHLAQVRRVLKPGGRYVLQTPNKWTNIPFELLRQWKKYHSGPIESYRAVVEDHCALHNYWQLRRRFARNGFDTSFVDVPVVTEYFKSKMRNYLGAVGPLLIAVLNPDHFPRPLRTNFYLVASLR
jgi:SAM-dependent methyltransferase